MFLCILLALSGAVLAKHEEWKRLPPTDESGGPATPRETPETTPRVTPAPTRPHITITPPSTTSAPAITIPWGVFTGLQLTTAAPTTLPPRATTAPPTTLPPRATTPPLSTADVATGPSTAASTRGAVGEEKTGLLVGGQSDVSGGDAENNGGNKKDKSLDNVAIGLIAGGVALFLLAVILTAVALLRKRAAAAAAAAPEPVAAQPPVFAREGTVESLYGAPPVIGQAATSQYGAAPALSAASSEYGAAPPLAMP